MGHRKKKDLAAIRRRVEGDEDDESHVNILDDDDDSFSEDSTLEEDSDNPESTQTFETGCVSLPGSPKSNGRSSRQQTLNGATIPSGKAEVPSLEADTQKTAKGEETGEKKKYSTIEWALDEELDDTLQNQKVVQNAQPDVKSNPTMNRRTETPFERRRREHMEYKKRRDEDPSFVPNRGAFFMHDHRHPGPAANGFRPFGRGRERGKMRARRMSEFSYHPMRPFDAPWTHDMHDVITRPSQDKSELKPKPKTNDLKSHNQHPSSGEKTESDSRALSVTKILGNVQIRIALPGMPQPVVFLGVPMKQYTRLPDHRPPLRRDKPVRISLPNQSPRHVFPTVDRSFIFISRAMRPNQQGFGSRGRGRRSVYGSVGGYSKRTSVIGDSNFGSLYSSSIVMSRRSSSTKACKRETVPSPPASTVSWSQKLSSHEKPVVRLPPTQASPQNPEKAMSSNSVNVKSDDRETSGPIEDSTKTQLSPRTSPVKEKPSIPQPTPQPTSQEPSFTPGHDLPEKLQFNPPLQQHQQPFHQQVPAQVIHSTFSNQSMMHHRNTAHILPVSTGTPLQQIPDRAIHAQPFQPHPYQLPQPVYAHPAQVVPQSQGLYYPQNLNPGIPLNSSNSPYIPLSQTQLPSQVSQSQQQENLTPQTSAQNLVAQEVNGMVYYYDASHIPAAATYPTYQNPPPYPVQHMGMVGMGMASPNPDGFYFAPASQGIMYYP